MWPFTRKPKPAIRPPLNEDWKPGDMAECIGDGWGDAKCRAPTIGTRAMVSAVFPGHFSQDGAPGWGLVLIGYGEAWDATGFRKIVLNENGADRKVAVRRGRKVRA